MWDFPWGLFALQQVAVPLLSMLATGAFAVLLGAVVPPGSQFAGDAAGVFAYVCPGVFGLVFGMLARSLGSAFRQAGGRIWLAPLSFFSVTFLIDLLSFGRQAVPEFFGIRGGSAEEGIVAVLVTLPTAACCFYSVGIRWRRKSNLAGTPIRDEDQHA
jgi:hypothetical protein